jgi:cyanate permease
MQSANSVTPNIKSPRLFFGWWINIITSLLCGISTGFIWQGSTVFFKSISIEFGMSRAATSVASGISSLSTGVLCLFVGWFVDKYGPRWMVIPGIILLSAGLFLMGFIHSAWQYYVVWGLVISCGNTLAFSLAIDKMLNNWFISKRGLAFGIRFTLLGIIAALLLPLVSWMSVTAGWRNTCIIWSAVTLAGLPLAWHFIKPRPPEYYGMLPDGAKMKSGSVSDQASNLAEGTRYAASLAEPDFSLKQTLRTAAFWLIAVVSIMQAIFWGFSVHTIPFITDKGITPVAAGSMVAISSLLAFPSRFLGGVLADRISKDHLRYLLLGSYLLIVLGIIILLLLPSNSSLYLFLILWFFGNGTFVPLSVIILARYFGRKAFGSIQGVLLTISLPVAFLTPILVGRRYDVSGSYTSVFIVFAVIGVLNAIVTYFMRPPATSWPKGDSSGASG